LRTRTQIAIALATFLFLGLIATVVPSLHGQSTNPDYAAAMKSGSQLLHQGMFDEAIHEYKDAIQLSSGKLYGPYLGLAMAYEKLDDTKNVLSSCDKMLALAPDDLTRALCHNLMGIALGRSTNGDNSVLARAEAEFRLALKLDPNFTVVHFNLGKLLLEETRDADAVAELKAYLADQPEGPDSDEAEQFIKDPNSARVGPEVTDASSEEIKVPEAGNAPPESPTGRAGAGVPAPDVTFTSTDGKRITFHDLQGKVVLVDFWASWCGPCRMAYPALGRIYDREDKNKFVLISISEDDDEQAWRSALAKNQPAWAQTRDSHHRLFLKFATGTRFGLPSYFIIDGKGVLRLSADGWSPSQDRRMAQEIDRWIKALPAASASNSSSH
jgi:thiol-disulfide isomerase/thioredoxin/Tfp pilus assembly protein PilF